MSSVPLDSTAFRKKQRVGSTSGLSALAAEESSRKSDLPSNETFVYNDRATADVVLHLVADRSVQPEGVGSEPFLAYDSAIYLHSRVIERSKYFAALLSDRWQPPEENRGGDASPSDGSRRIYRSFYMRSEPTQESVDHRLMALRLLYAYDDSDMLSEIDSVSTAINLLEVALELLFEDCVRVCVRFLEAVPWSEEEEAKILNLIPHLKDEESDELLARITPSTPNLCEEMLEGLITSAIHNHPNMAFAKAFVAKLLRDFTSKDVAGKVLERAFKKSLSLVKQSMEEYTSPHFRGDHSEMEAIQKMNLHTAMTIGKHLLWLVERMVELKVADVAVETWSDQSAFTSDLKRVFREDLWRSIAPSFPSIILRCTCRLVNALTTGRILASRQIRAKIVRDWLPVLIVCKDTAPPLGPNHKSSLHLELEEAFLKIISTLPMSDSQELLQQCLSLSTRNVDDCQHLVDAFTTWLRRANLPLRKE